MLPSREIAIEVAVAMPVHGTFTYRVPEDLARLASAGTRVLVPFGRRRATGYVLGPAPPSDRADIKLIVDVLDARPVFPGAMIPFLRWTADYYKHPLGQVIETALPGGLTEQLQYQKHVTLPGQPPPVAPSPVAPSPGNKAAQSGDDSSVDGPKANREPASANSILPRCE